MLDVHCAVEHELVSVVVEEEAHAKARRVHHEGAEEHCTQRCPLAPSDGWLGLRQQGVSLP